MRAERCLTKMQDAGGRNGVVAPLLRLAPLLLPAPPVDPTTDTAVNPP